MFFKNTCSSRIHVCSSYIYERIYFLQEHMCVLHEYMFFTYICVYVLLDKTFSRIHVCSSYICVLHIYMSICSSWQSFCKDTCGSFWMREKYLEYCVCVCACMCVCDAHIYVMWRNVHTHVRYHKMYTHIHARSGMFDNLPSGTSACAPRAFVYLQIYIALWNVHACM